MAKPSFTRCVIGELDNSAYGCDMNTFLTVGDLNRNGRPDVVLSGRDGQMAWFENTGEPRTWKRHLIGMTSHQECGGVIHDLTGDGWPDIIIGGDWRSDEVAWWENPGAAASAPNPPAWTRRVVARTSKNQFHDELIGDITGDGRISLVFWNQKAGSLNWVPLPADPRQSPWPEIQTIAANMKEKGQPEEGLAIADIDGDGKPELIAGTHWYKYTGRAGQQWEQYKYAKDYITTVIAVGDIDGDGKPEIVISEGDACIYGYPQGGKLGWFKPGANVHDLWVEHRLEEHLLDPHSLQLGSLCDTGHLDILVGEIGKRETLLQQKPRLMIYENDGKANFTQHVIDEGTGTHHARLADLRKKGVLDIVSRPLHGPEKWKLFAWYNNAGGPVA